jgi:hypothetical protein
MVPMSHWGRSLYAEPCRECAFSWEIDVGSTDVIVAGAPDRFAQLLVGRDPASRSPGCAWSAYGYVWHVADNFRVWAERVMALVTTGDNRVVTYDPSTLGAARGYESLPVSAALWSLGRAVDDWHAAFGRVEQEPGVILRHPVGSALTLVDVRRQLAHEVQHHALDVGRALEASTPRGRPTVGGTA